MATKTRHDTRACVAACRRMIAATGRRAAHEDPWAIAALDALHADLEAATAEAIAGQRAAGIRWESIGEALGVTRQAALMKWGPKAEALG